MMKFPIRWTTRYSVIEEENNNIYIRLYRVYICIPYIVRKMCILSTQSDMHWNAATQNSKILYLIYQISASSLTRENVGNLK